ncbi:MarR family winged helix-turn-helix transcriptional regulator [Bacillota bacterium Meth-B3]|nr:MarR family transcriptional regulator [Christensenellaceae bacterium]
MTVVDTERLVREVIDLTPLLKRHILRPMETAGHSRVAPNQLSILSSLMENGPQSMARLGRQICVCRQQMTGLIDELIRKGLVERSRGEMDRRTVTIELTDQGREMVLEQEREMMRALYPIFDRYSEERKAGLIETARTMRDIIAHG